MQKHNALFVIAIVSFLSPLATVGFYKAATARPRITVTTVELPEMVVIAAEGK